MRMFKWNLSFSTSRESSVAPVWIRLAGLPLYLFEGSVICSIAQVVGTPLSLDPRTLNRTDLSFARICIEMDVSKQGTDSIWVSIVDEKSKVQTDGFWLKVLYDSLPLYCQACWHIGHGQEQCKVPVSGQAFDEMYQPVKPNISVVVEHSKVSSSEMPPFTSKFANQSITPVNPKGVGSLSTEKNFRVDKDGFISKQGNEGKAFKNHGASKELPMPTKNRFGALEQGPGMAVGVVSLTSPQAIPDSTPKAPAEKQITVCTAKTTGEFGQNRGQPEKGLTTSKQNKIIPQEQTQPPKKVQFAEPLSTQPKSTFCRGESSGSKLTEKSSEISMSREKEQLAKEDTVEQETILDKTGKHSQEDTNSILSPQKYIIVKGMLTKAWADEVAEEVSKEDVSENVDQVQHQQEKGNNEESCTVQEKPENKEHTVDIDRQARKKQEKLANLRRLISQDDTLNKHGQILDYNERGYRLIIRRSLSPVGRTSPRLKSLRHKTNTIKIGTDITDIVKLQDYEEFFEADMNRIRKEKQGRTRGNPTGLGQQKTRRNRGRYRGYGTPNQPRFRGKGQH